MPPCRVGAGNTSAFLRGDAGTVGPVGGVQDQRTGPPLSLASPSSRPPTQPSALPYPAACSSSTPPSCSSAPLSLLPQLSLFCPYKGHENMFQHEELVGSSWIGAYSALCFSCGYDAYDQLDMLRYRLYSGWIPGILMHHLFCSFALH